MLNEVLEALLEVYTESQIEFKYDFISVECRGCDTLLYVYVCIYGSFLCVSRSILSKYIYKCDKSTADAMLSVVNVIQKLGIKFCILIDDNIYDLLVAGLIPGYTKPFCITHRSSLLSCTTEGLYILTSDSTYEDCRSLLVQRLSHHDSIYLFDLRRECISEDHKYAELAKHVFDSHCNENGKLLVYEFMFQLYSATVIPTKRAI